MRYYQATFPIITRHHRWVTTRQHFRLLPGNVLGYYQATFLVITRQHFGLLPDSILSYCIIPACLEREMQRQQRYCHSQRVNLDPYGTSPGHAARRRRGVLAHERDLGGGGQHDGGDEHGDLQQQLQACRSHKEPSTAAVAARCRRHRLHGCVVAPADHPVPSGRC